MLALLKYPCKHPFTEGKPFKDCFVWNNHSPDGPVIWRGYKFYIVVKSTMRESHFFSLKIKNCYVSALLYVANGSILGAPEWSLISALRKQKSDIMSPDKELGPLSHKHCTEK